MEKHTFEELKAMNLHDLRKIAYVIGVYAPTLGTKNDLIKKVMEVENGIVQPIDEKMAKRGRRRTLIVEEKEESKQADTEETQEEQPKTDKKDAENNEKALRKDLLGVFSRFFLELSSIFDHYKNKN